MGEQPVLTDLIFEADIPYGIGGGRTLLLDILRPDVPPHPERPAVIWVHGGGWSEGERFPSPNAPLAQRGFVTASISYRFLDEAIFPAQIHDVKAAIRFLRSNAARWGIDAESIGIWGGSAGGHLAALAAVSGGMPLLEGDGGYADESSLVQAAVALAPPTDFQVDWNDESDMPLHEGVIETMPLLFGGPNLTDPDIAWRTRLASPVALATAAAPPMLVVHGTLDELVPVAQGRRLVARLQEVGAEAEMLELPADDHGLHSLFGEEGNGGKATSPAMRRVYDFFERTLGPVTGWNLTGA